MLLLRLIYNELLAFNRYFEGDKRFKAYPLMDKPWPMIAILIIYGLTALKWGPKFMAKRKPFKVDGIMKLYNVVQVLLNAWAVLEGAKIIFVGNDIKLICQEYIPNNTSPAIMSLLAPTLAYCYMKYLDLFDTLFFLARKKFNQVTFLHVYHHITMVLCVHLYMVNLYGSQFLFIGFVNSIIHVIMYSYYLLAALKPKINLEPFKRTLTKLQLLQFLFLTVYMGTPLFLTGCNLPKFWLIMAVVQNLFMVALFSNFYYKAYILNDRKRSKAE